MGREVAGRGGRPVSYGRGSLIQARAGDTGRVRPGRVAGSVPQLAYGTSRGRLGRGRVRVVGRLREGDDEERQGDRNCGDRMHAPPGPSRINLMGHRLSHSPSRTSARSRRGTTRYYERDCVAASCSARSAFRALPMVPRP